VFEATVEDADEAVAEGGSSMKADFDKVSGIIDEVMGLDELARRFDPAMASFNLAGLGISDQTLGQVWATWRDESWVNASRLLAISDPAARQQVLAGVEATAANRAAAIRAATAYRPFISSTQRRDQYCASHHGD